MRGFVLLSLIIFASTSIGYGVGYHVGRKTISSSETCKPDEPSTPPHPGVNLNCYQDTRTIDTWVFPCNVIIIEMIEREKKDEELYNELNENIEKFLIDKSTQHSLSNVTVPVFATTIKNEDKDTHCFINERE